ncbi:hypothetical protein PV327_001609 [Microctonus hyperodae]|uniref:Protein arginine N-methyltransferase n=1 Tax=Microctonus hyperodae TaxID=165561 RepID=A0AA39KNG2_MICHY|nr:hypothetical protein PV327_001609 [Microctonus hyperodae]
MLKLSQIIFRPLSLVPLHINSITFSLLTGLVLKPLPRVTRVCTSKMSIFTQTFDPITGCSTWVEKNPDYDYHQEVAQSAFADMLHDHERNEKYYIALKRAIEKIHKAGCKANVLDIGTGTGLLSMMAAKCGADTITACEAFRPMADCAEKILKLNGFGSRVNLVRKRSTEMIVGENGDMKRRANILVTEVFDTELIGEGALSTFKHAHDVLLEENCIVIPKKAIVWGQIIESDTAKSWNRMNPITDLDNSKIIIEPPSAINTCSGSSAVHDVQLSQLPETSFRSLHYAEKIFIFDWSSNQRLIFDDRKTIPLSVITSGTTHALFMWWDLIMDDDEEILLSCAPIWQHPDAATEYKSKSSDTSQLIPWRDHWMQAIYYFPKEITLEVGDKIDLVGYHDEYSFWFQVKQHSGDEPIKRLACTCTVHLAYSRARIGQLNDTERNNKYIDVLRKHITSNTICFSFSDGSLLGLAAAKLGAKKVIILEPNYLSRRALNNFITANDLTTSVEVIQSNDEISKVDVKANLVIGEPYYVNSIYPWDNLRFWYLASKYAPGISTVPIGARIRGIVVEFDNLYKIRAPLGVCEGFDLSVFDELLLRSSEISDNPVEVHPLWEYPAKPRTLPFDIAYFDFSNKFDNTSERIFSGQVPVFSSGSCNGVALWIDWYLDSETVVSGGPLSKIETNKYISWEMNTRQGVHLLRNFKNVKADNVISWLLKCHFGREHYLSFNFKLDTKT